MTTPEPPAMPEAMVGAYIHARRRLNERYGLDIGRVEFMRLCLDVSAAFDSNRAEQLAKVKNGCWLLRVKLKGENVRVIFDPGSGVIKTFWHPSMKASSKPGEAKQRWIKKRRNKPQKREKYRGWA